MTYTSVFTLDPGLRSGWAMWESGKFHAGISDPMDMCDQIEMWTNHHAEKPGTLMVVEAFVVNAMTHKKDPKSLNWPWELTGVARYMAHRANIHFITQKPSAAMRFAPDEKLKRHGFYTPGKEDHARDASRHLTLVLSQLQII